MLCLLVWAVWLGAASGQDICLSSKSAPADTDAASIMAAEWCGKTEAYCETAGGRPCMCMGKAAETGALRYCERAAKGEVQEPCRWTALGNADWGEQDCLVTTSCYETLADDCGPYTALRDCMDGYGMPCACMKPGEYPRNCTATDRGCIWFHLATLQPTHSPDSKHKHHRIPCDPEGVFGMLDAAVVAHAKLRLLFLALLLVLL